MSQNYSHSLLKFKYIEIYVKEYCRKSNCIDLIKYKYKTLWQNNLNWPEVLIKFHSSMFVYFILSFSTAAQPNCIVLTTKPLLAYDNNLPLNHGPLLFPTIQQ